MKIGICDDESYIVETLNKMITYSLQKINMDIDIDIITFTSPKELLKSVEDIEILFLDLDMPDLDGIEVGKMIYKKNPSCKLIIATGRTDRFKEAFKIHVCRFITKPFQQDEVDEALSATMRHSGANDSLEFYIHRIRCQVQQKNIRYIRAYNSYIEAVTMKNCYRRDSSLCTIEKLLDQRLFFRINKQYIINLSYVNAYDNNFIYIGKEIFTVARSKRKNFLQKFIMFIESED